MARVIGKIVTELRTEFVQTCAGRRGRGAAAGPEPPPLRDVWREAAFSVIAQSLVRRERAQLRKRHVEEFYRSGSCPRRSAELRPWLLRLPDPEQREQATQHVLTVWADAALETVSRRRRTIWTACSRAWGDARGGARPGAQEAIDG